MCSNRRHRWWLFWQLKLLDGPQLESHMETYILQNTWFCGNSTQDKMSFSSLCGTLCTRKCTFPICDVNIYQVTESYNINTFTKVAQTDKSRVELILYYLYCQKTCCLLKGQRRGSRFEPDVALSSEKLPERTETKWAAVYNILLFFHFPCYVSKNHW